MGRMALTGGSGCAGLDEALKKSINVALALAWRALAG